MTHETDPGHNAGPRRKVLWLGAIVLACVAGAGGYAAHVAQGRQAAAAQAPALVQGAAQAPLPAGEPLVYFRSTATGESYGRVMAVPVAAPGGERRLTPLQCDRVYFAAGHGICLTAERGVTTTYRADLFDAAMKVTHQVPLAGPPSRARVSPDGRLAAMTVFIAGHNYANTDFTTRASVVDTATGRFVVDDLESFSVTRQGQAFKPANANFWGITFARDPNRFYATMGSGSERYLVEGDLAARSMKVVHDRVECPSLSPDNRRVAFKRRAAADAGGRVAWRIVVLDLASGQETELTREERSVDDQVEWLSDTELAYALPDTATPAAASTTVWALAADGSQPPRALMPFAMSPAVVRAGS